MTRQGSSRLEHARLTAGVLVCAALLGGCAALVPQTAALREAPPASLPARMELVETPFFPQEDYQCGPAALATALVHSKAEVTPEKLVPYVYLPERKGSLQVEMLAAARRHGRVSYQLAPRLEDLLREIAAGTPVIVLLNLGVFEHWHYAVAIGYDLEAGELLLRSGREQRLVLPFPVHELLWRRSEHWAMVAMAPERIPASASGPRWLAAIAALERSGDARNARTAYETFLKRWPGNADAAVGLANAHHALGALDQAEAVLRGAADRHPRSVVVLNNLAQTLSDKGHDREALALIERAVAAGGPFANAARETRELILKRIAGRK